MYKVIDTVGLYTSLHDPQRWTGSFDLDVILYFYLVNFCFALVPFFCS